MKTNYQEIISTLQLDVSQVVGRKAGDKEAVLIIGRSNSGKTTLSQYIAGTTVENENSDSPKLHKFPELMCLTQSEYKNLSIWDLPGFCNTINPLQDIVSLRCINEIVKIYKEVKIVVIISEKSFEGKAEGFTEFVNLIGQMFIGSAAPENFVFIISMATIEDSGSLADFLQSILDEVIIQYPDLLKVLIQHAKSDSIIFFNQEQNTSDVIRNKITGAIEKTQHIKEIRDAFSSATCHVIGELVEYINSNIKLVIKSHGKELLDVCKDKSHKSQLVENIDLLKKIDSIAELKDFLKKFTLGADKSCNQLIEELANLCVVSKFIHHDKMDIIFGNYKQQLLANLYQNLEILNEQIISEELAKIEEDTQGKLDKLSVEIEKMRKNYHLSAQDATEEYISKVKDIISQLSESVNCKKNVKDEAHIESQIKALIFLGDIYRDQASYKLFESKESNLETYIEKIKSYDPETKILYVTRHGRYHTEYKYHFDQEKLTMQRFFIKNIQKSITQYVDAITILESNNKINNFNKYLIVSYEWCFAISTLLGKIHTNSQLTNTSKKDKYKQDADRYLQKLKDINPDDYAKYQEMQNKLQGWCKILSVNDILYDNQLLNYPDILEKAIKVFGMNKAIELGSKLDAGLIKSANDEYDYEIVLAALLSLDNEVGFSTGN